jgi:hypothetical protein
MLPSQTPSHGFRCRATDAGHTDIGLGNNFQQRRAGAVQIDARHAVEVLVQRLACIFLEVSARQPYRLQVGLTAFGLYDEAEAAALHYRNLVLADLVALRQVRIEVILAREHAARRDRGADRESKTDRALDRAAVQYRQGAGQRNVDDARLRVGRGAERGRGARKNLAHRRELGMRLQTDYHFPCHRGLHSVQRFGWSARQQAPRFALLMRIGLPGHLS